MKEPAIERKLKKWMPKIISGNQRALNSLMRHVFMLELLNRIAKWAERRKKITVDEESGTDIREIVAARIRDKLHTIKNPNNAPWRMVVTKWSYAVAGRCCEDVRKKNARIVDEYDTEISEPVSTWPSPEEELERKEQVPLRERLEAKIHETAFAARAAATPEQKRILSLWAEGKKLKQIAEATGLSLSNAQLKLKKIQRAIAEKIWDGIVEEIGEAKAAESGVAEVLEEVVEKRDDLRELLANSAREMRGRGPRPHA